jgi:hypothetical protein
MWFVASCDSKPRASRISGVAMIPALFRRMWSGRPEPTNRAANASIEAGSARSRLSSSIRSNPAREPRAFSTVRAGTMTIAPADARARVVSNPTPTYPPVTTATTPSSRLRPITSRAVVFDP